MRIAEMAEIKEHVAGHAESNRIGRESIVSLCHRTCQDHSPVDNDSGTHKTCILATR